MVSGWPDLLDVGEREASLWLSDYLRTLAEVDVPGLVLGETPATSHDCWPPLDGLQRLR